MSSELDRPTGRMRWLARRVQYEDVFGHQETTSYVLQMEFKSISAGESDTEWRDVPLVDEDGNELQLNLSVARWV
jgi:hypothetical protein